MGYSIESIAQTLKAARKKMKISQRALSAKTGFPQSHISKIEKGEVDLQASSLIELARCLDLELMLVPRSLIPIVKALQRDRDQGNDSQTPLYSLEGEEDD